MPQLPKDLPQTLMLVQCVTAVLNPHLLREELPLVVLCWWPQGVCPAMWDCQTQSCAQQSAYVHKCTRWQQEQVQVSTMHVVAVMCALCISAAAIERLL